MKHSLFGKNVAPACKYCENSRSDKTVSTVFCNKRGAVEPDFSCKKFVYAPLKRTYPAPPPPIKYDKSEFEL